MRKLAALLMSFVFFAACGGSSSDFTGGSPNSLPLSQVPAAIGKSACDALARCSKIFYPILYAVTDCPSTFAAQFTEATFNDINRVVTAGTVSYDPAAGQACADAVESGACAELDNDLPAPCQQAFKGTVPAGGACSIAAECSDPNSRCDTSAGTCPGKCAPRSSAGVACQVDDDCALGSICSKITAKCTTPPGDGAACGGGVNDDCAAGYLCVGDDKNARTPGACQSQDSVLVGVDGADCSIKTGPLCEPGLSCVIGTLSAALDGKCQKPVAAGAACHIALPSECPVGQYCPLTLAQALLGMTGSCADLPGAGEACAPDIALAVCGKDLVCDSSGKCSSKRELGQSCMNDDECVSNHCINQGCSPASACAM